MKTSRTVMLCGAVIALGANELDDRLVVTWDTSEPASGQQDVTFVRTPHHFQAVLYRDGRVDLSYQEMTARDGVVGVYTVPAPRRQLLRLQHGRRADRSRAGAPLVHADASDRQRRDD
jgi:hypothetical protein